MFLVTLYSKKVRLVGLNSRIRRTRVTMTILQFADLKKTFRECFDFVTFSPKI